MPVAGVLLFVAQARWLRKVDASILAAEAKTGWKPPYRQARPTPIVTAKTASVSAARVRCATMVCRRLHRQAEKEAHYPAGYLPVTIRAVAAA